MCFLFYEIKIFFIRWRTGPTYKILTTYSILFLVPNLFYRGGWITSEVLKTFLLFFFSYSSTYFTVGWGGGGVCTSIPKDSLSHLWFSRRLGAVFIIHEILELSRVKLGKLDSHLNLDSDLVSFILNY